MSQEGQLLDFKSLRAVTGKTADWNEIAKDCIAFANATGGRLLLGIEDGEELPPTGQHIPTDLPDTLRRKLAERTVNVTVLPDIVTAANGAQYIELRIPRALSDTSRLITPLGAIKNGAIENGRYTGTGPINQRLLSATGNLHRAIAPLIAQGEQG